MEVVTVSFQNRTRGGYQYEIHVTNYGDKDYPIAGRVYVGNTHYALCWTVDGRSSVGPEYDLVRD